MPTTVYVYFLTLVLLTSLASAQSGSNSFRAAKPFLRDVARHFRAVLECDVWLHGDPCLQVDLASLTPCVERENGNCEPMPRKLILLGDDLQDLNLEVTIKII